MSKEDQDCWKKSRTFNPFLLKWSQEQNAFLLSNRTTAKTAKLFKSPLFDKTKVTESISIW